MQTSFVDEMQHYVVYIVSNSPTIYNGIFETTSKGEVNKIDTILTIR